MLKNYSTRTLSGAEASKAMNVILLKTKTGKAMGEQSMWAEVAEKAIMKNSKEVCPGLYVCGMCANAVFGGPRMGPIFGGMLLSGEKVAKALIGRL